MPAVAQSSSGAGTSFTPPQVLRVGLPRSGLVQRIAACWMRNARSYLDVGHAYAASAWDCAHRDSATVSSDWVQSAPRRFRKRVPSPRVPAQRCLSCAAHEPPSNHTLLEHWI